MPDFDVDFCTDRRGEVIEYTKRRYGEDHVAGIVTYGCMKAKNAVRDVTRALGFPHAVGDAIAKEIPNKPMDGLKASAPLLKFYFGTTGKPEDEKYIIAPLRKMYEDDDDVKKIIAFVQKGGILVADVEPATFDELGRKRNVAALDELFGVKIVN